MKLSYIAREVRPLNQYFSSRIVNHVKYMSIGVSKVVWQHFLNERQQGYLKKYLKHRNEKRYSYFFNLYQKYGVETVIEEVNKQCRSEGKRARIFLGLSRLVMSVNVGDALILLKLSVAYDSRVEWKLKCGLAAWDNGSISFAWELIQGLPQNLFSSVSILEKIRQIEGAYILKKHLPQIPSKEIKPVYSPEPNVSMYVASSSRPYHVTGYTSRTHDIIQALQHKGWTVHCVTRPGYPLDRSDAKYITKNLVNESDGVCYERLRGNHRRQVRYDEYLNEAAERVVEAALRIKPSIIHAASNYESGLPALIAARRLGIPFIYEVRGLWEYTSASKKLGWENTERFDLDRSIESLVSCHADHVFTLTQALSSELVSRYVSLEKISLLPNAINAERFKRIKRNDVLATSMGLDANHFVIGYVGSIVAYEGLDDLITAVGILKKELPQLRLIIVGDGDARFSLEEQVKKAELDNVVIFIGKVSPEEVKKYYSLFNLSVLPRKPFKVCELVSPLKPLESMAMGIPLLVSSVPALAEMVEHGCTALVHDAGDPYCIADKILILSKNSGMAKMLARNALEFVHSNRTWDQVVEEIVQQYSRLVEANI
ncbi:hypothetical protein CGX12_16135 [Zobellella denitrificans]|uniref:glycosyltransferase family 4 protein n=1 Tax=Zobellella denitrificans TaxID=347534 RepID=UPI000B8BC3A5|nr:glycosyltransferase family 4 protein [Zobellella denitrificans]OXS14091.1 hypothetical protein CGX12_16135 [Zobellella denitrificans]